LQRKPSLILAIRSVTKVRFPNWQIVSVLTTPELLILVCESAAGCVVPRLFLDLLRQR
jgi:hypothetical protein